MDESVVLLGPAVVENVMPIKSVHTIKSELLFNETNEAVSF